MLPLTELQKQQYIAAGCLECPFCRSTQIEGGGRLESGGDGYRHTVTCKHCERSWVDVYTVTDVEDA